VDLDERARKYAALGDRVRLAIVDDLLESDRAPVELAARHGLASNLLAHHLEVLEEAGLIERLRSSGDGRRRYVRLRQDAVNELQPGRTPPTGTVLFVCTHNSARSQMAAVAWSAALGTTAVSAGTHPADRVHPGAVAAAARAGFDLSAARPRLISDIDVTPALVVTVCDRAHEELEVGSDWWHWSIPDPVEGRSQRAFDEALDNVMARIEAVAGVNDEQ